MKEAASMKTVRLTEPDFEGSYWVPERRDDGTSVLQPHSERLSAVVEETDGQVFLAMLDEVAATGEEILVTKRGRPVARVVAVSEPAQLAGSGSFLVCDDELVAPLDERWDAEQG
jgi:prevent-host-death family protein